MAADLYFSDRLLGPLISTHGHTSNRITIVVMLIQVIVAASLAAAVVLAADMKATTADNTFTGTGGSMFAGE